MADDTIQETIEIRGDDAIATFDKFGRAGEQAFNKIKAAADKAKGIGDNITASAAKLQSSLQSTATTATSAGQALVNTFRAPLPHLDSATAASISFGGAIRGIGTAVVSGARGLENLNTGVLNVGTSIKTGIASVATFTIGLLALPSAFFAIAQSASNSASAIKAQAAQAGTTTDEFQKLQFAAGRLGADGDALVRVLGVLNDASGKVEKTTFENNREFTKLNRTFTTSTQFQKDYLALQNQISDKTDDATDAFHRFGIRLVDDIGNARSAVEILKDISDNIAALPTPADKASRAIEFFGRRIGSTVTPLLEKGRAGLESLGNEATRTHQVLTPLQIQIGRDLSIAAGNFNRQLAALKNNIGLAFSPAFTSLFNTFSASLVNNFDKIQTSVKPITDLLNNAVRSLLATLKENPDFVTNVLSQIASTLADIAKAAVIVGGIVVTAFKLVSAALQPVADLFNLIAQSNLVKSLLPLGTVIPELTGSTLAWVIQLGALFGIFSLIGRIAGVVISIFSGFASIITGIPALLTVLSGALSIAASVLSTVAAALVRLSIALLATPAGWVILAAAAGAAATLLLINFGPQLWDELKKGADGWRIWFMSTWVGDVIRFIGKVITAVGLLIDAFKALWRTRQKVTSDLTTTGPVPDESDPNAFAAGGYVRGRGGIDKIPAWLTNKEFVHNADAVRYYGTSVMHAINRMRIPKTLFQGFNLGGFVTPQPRLRFSTGGQARAAPALRPLSLTIGNDIFAGLLAPESVAQKLVQVATAKQIRSAGRRPGFYGRGK